MRHPLQCLSFVLLTALGAGCQSDHPAIADGVEVVRGGVVDARDAMTVFRAGEREAGLRRMQAAQEVMADGMSMIESGMSCCSMCGDSMASMTGAMETMAVGMEEMGRACDMMADSDPTNDAAADANMESGMNMMEDGAEAMEGSASDGAMGAMGGGM